MSDDEFILYIQQKLDHRLEILWYQMVHQITWGVSCGPTIEMVPVETPLNTFERYLRGNV